MFGMSDVKRINIAAKQQADSEPMEVTDAQPPHAKQVYWRHILVTVVPDLFTFIL